MNAIRAILSLWVTGAITSADQQAWMVDRDFKANWNYETHGKPAQMLQVGKLPTLGCMSPPFA